MRVTFGLRRHKRFYFFEIVSMWVDFMVRRGSYEGAVRGVFGEFFGVGILGIEEAFSHDCRNIR